MTPGYLHGSSVITRVLTGARQEDQSLVTGRVWSGVRTGPAAKNAGGL